MFTKSHARAAACTVAAILALNAAVNAVALVYWNLGGTWGGEAALSASDQLRSVLMVVVGLAYAGILLVRAGYWHEHMPSAVVRFADIPAWLVVIIPLGGALQAFTTFDDPVSGVGNLIIAALAFVVVRAEGPVSMPSGPALPPSGKPGPPTSAH